MTQIEKLPTIIINLKKNTDRKVAIKSKIKKTKLNNYIFLEAVDGNTELHKYNFKVIPNWIDPITKKKISVGCIGCALSHYYAWKYIVDNNIEKALILEDDTTFYKNFDTVLNNILHQNIDYDMFYLNRRALNNLYNLGEEIQINNNIVIAKYSYNMSTYIITNSGASKLLKSNCLDNIMPIDELVPILYDINYPFKNYSKYFEKYEKIKALALKNDIACQESRELFPSTIEESNDYYSNV